MQVLSAALWITAVFLGPLSPFQRTVSSKESGRVIQKEGENLTIECMRKENSIGLYLYKKSPMQHEVFYYDLGSKKLTENQEYKERFKISDGGTIIIKLSNLQVTDSGLYSCAFSHLDDDMNVVYKNGADVFLLVKESCAESTALNAGVPQSLVLVIVVTACAVLILCALVVVVWIVPKVKALCVSPGNDASRTRNGIYEEMRTHSVRLKD